MMSKEDLEAHAPKAGTMHLGYSKALLSKWVDREVLANHKSQPEE